MFFNLYVRMNGEECKNRNQAQHIQPGSSGKQIKLMACDKRDSYVWCIYCD